MAFHQRYNTNNGSVAAARGGMVVGRLRPTSAPLGRGKQSDCDFHNVSSLNGFDFGQQHCAPLFTKSRFGALPVGSLFQEATHRHQHHQDQHGSFNTSLNDTRSTSMDARLRAFGRYSKRLQDASHPRQQHSFHEQTAPDKRERFPQKDTVEKEEDDFVADDDDDDDDDEVAPSGAATAASSNVDHKMEESIAKWNAQRQDTNNKNKSTTTSVPTRSESDDNAAGFIFRKGGGSHTRGFCAATTHKNQAPQPQKMVQPRRATSAQAKRTTDGPASAAATTTTGVRDDFALVRTGQQLYVPIHLERTLPPKGSRLSDKLRSMSRQLSVSGDFSTAANDDSKETQLQVEQDPQPQILLETPEAVRKRHEENHQKQSHALFNFEREVRSLVGKDHAARLYKLRSKFKLEAEEIAQRIFWRDWPVFVESRKGELLREHAARREELWHAHREVVLDCSCERYLMHCDVVNFNEETARDVIERTQNIRFDLILSEFIVGVPAMAATAFVRAFQTTCEGIFVEYQDTFDACFRAVLVQCLKTREEIEREEIEAVSDLRMQKFAIQLLLDKNIRRLCMRYYLKYQNLYVKWKMQKRKLNQYAKARRLEVQNDHVFARKTLFRWMQYVAKRVDQNVDATMLRHNNLTRLLRRYFKNCKSFRLFAIRRRERRQHLSKRAATLLGDNENVHRRCCFTPWFERTRDKETRKMMQDEHWERLNLVHLPEMSEREVVQRDAVVCIGDCAFRVDIRRNFKAENFEVQHASTRRATMQQEAASFQALQLEWITYLEAIQRRYMFDQMQQHEFCRLRRKEQEETRLRIPLTRLEQQNTSVVTRRYLSKLATFARLRVKRRRKAQVHRRRVQLLASVEGQVSQRYLALWQRFVPLSHADRTASEEDALEEEVYKFVDAVMEDVVVGE